MLGFVKTIVHIKAPPKGLGDVRIQTNNSELIGLSLWKNDDHCTGELLVDEMQLEMIEEAIKEYKATLT